MTLLDLLRELEPDAGWKLIHHFRRGFSECACNATARINVFSGPQETAGIRVNIFDLDMRSKAWRKCEATAPDLPTALQMALTGYRAGETP